MKQQGLNVFSAPTKLSSDLLFLRLICRRTTAEHYRYCPFRETARTQRFLWSNQAEYRPSVSATHMPAGTSLVNASSHSVHTTGLSPNPPRPRLQSGCDRPASKPDRHRPIRARSNRVGQPWTGGVPVHAPCQLPVQISLLIGNSARASRNSTRLGYQIQPIAC